MFGLGYLKMAGGVVAIAALWLVYSWGSEIITNYGNMASEIATLKRDKALITSRVDSYKILLARRDDAIAASKCASAIRAMIKDPDTIPRKSDPFNPNTGGN